MKTYLILFILAVSSSQSIYAQLAENEIASLEECSRYYKYGLGVQGLVDLEKVRLLKKDSVVDSDFKTCSKFAHRYSSHWNDSLTLDDKLFVIVNEDRIQMHELHIIQNEHETQIVQLPVKYLGYSIDMYHFSMMPFKNTIIVMLSDDSGNPLNMVKYDTNGNLLMTQDIGHTYVSRPDSNKTYYYHWPWYNNLTKSQMVFSSRSDYLDTAKTVLFNLDDFRLDYFYNSTRGIILDSLDEELIGFVSIDRDRETRTSYFEVEMTNGVSYDFTIKNGQSLGNFLLHDSLLYIVNFDPIYSDFGLHCFDLKTKNIIWSADELQGLPNRYGGINSANLSVYKNKILLEATEYMEESLQVFDCKTGRHLGAFGIIDFKIDRD